MGRCQDLCENEHDLNAFQTLSNDDIFDDNEYEDDDSSEMMDQGHRGLGDWALDDENVNNYEKDFDIDEQNPLYRGNMHLPEYSYQHRG